MTKSEELNIYKEDDGINQSFLKNVLINNPVDKGESDTIATYKGSLTDTLTLVPELFDEFYHLTELEKAPTPLIKKTLDAVYEQIGEWDNLAFIETYRQFSDAKTPTKEETILKGVEGAVNYWDELMKSSGKKVITQDYYRICNTASMTLKSHPNVKHCFENTIFSDIQYQIPLYCDFEIEGIKVRLKGLLDMLEFNYHEKTVRIRDLKTSSVSPEEWKFIARRFRYDFQMAFYYYLVNILYPEFKQLMPELVIYSFAAPSKPFIKVFTEDDLFGGRYGFERLTATNIYERVEESATHDSIFYHGWETAMQRYIQAKQLGLSDYDIDYFRNPVSQLNLWI